MFNIKNLMARSLVRSIGKEFSGEIVKVLSGLKNEPPKIGTSQILDAYNTMPWLRAIINKTSTGTSSQKWKIFVERGKNKKVIRNHKAQSSDSETRTKIIKQGLKAGTIEEIEKHPLLDVLNNGNEFLLGASNLKVAQIHLDTVGEAFLLKKRSIMGVPDELWPLPPHWIQDVASPGKEFFKLSNGQLQSDIPKDEIIWLKDPNPKDPYSRGSGIARAIADELETDEYAAKHTKSWFFNNARPDIIVSAPGLEKGDTKRLENDWLGKNQGFFKRFKPYFMSGEIKVTELNQSFKDMELIKLREFERDLFIQVFGIPPEMLGILESSNRATIESADFIFSKWVIHPRLELQRSAFQYSLAMDYDENIILDYESPIKEDRAFQLEVMKSAPFAFSVDEWREKAGDEELPDGKGKVYAIDFNKVFQSDFTEPNIIVDEVDKKSQKKTEKVALTPEQNAMIKSVLLSIRINPLIEAIRPNLRAIVETYGETLVSSIIDEHFTISDPRVTEFLTTRTLQRTQTLINNTTKKKIERQLVEGFGEGETVEDIAKRINKVFDNASSNRSKVIARTETVRAANFGTQEGMSQARVPNKQWLSSRDSVVRDSHSIGAGMDTQTVPINANFSSPITGAEGPHPGEMHDPKEDIQCRCTIVPVFDVDDTRSSYSEERKTKIWKAFEHQRRPFEKRLRKDVNKAFEIQRQAALEALKIN